jgi:rhodanese-related sulfurtransferase
MERWLRELGLEYRLAYVEDHEREVDRYGVRQSPSLVVDDELVFRGLPSQREFNERLGRAGEVPTGGPEGSGSFDRLSSRGDGPQVPEPVSGEAGLFRVDATWGTIQPMEVADGVRTVGELEVMEHLRAGLRVVDARTPGWFERATIPGADNIPHTDVVDRMGELDPSEPTIFFCNGPQCAQSPWAIEALLEAGYPAEAILYYRGGMHDWLTLGLPVSRP